jgi:hypothetical protein
MFECSAAAASSAARLAGMVAMRARDSAWRLVAVVTQARSRQT